MLKQFILALSILSVAFSFQARATELSLVLNLNSVLGTLKESQPFPVQSTPLTFGLGCGLLAEQNLNPQWSVETGLLYKQITVTKNYEAASKYSWLSTSYSAVQLPVQLFYRVSANIAVGVGAYYQRRVGNSYFDDLEFQSGLRQWSSASFSDQDRSDDYGLMASVRGELPITEKAKAVGHIQYNHGLADASSLPGGIQNYRQITLLLGFKVPL